MFIIILILVFAYRYNFKVRFGFVIWCARASKKLLIPVDVLIPDAEVMFPEILGWAR